MTLQGKFSTSLIQKNRLGVASGLENSIQKNKRVVSFPKNFPIQWKIQLAMKSDRSFWASPGRGSPIHPNKKGQEQGIQTHSPAKTSVVLSSRVQIKTSRPAAHTARGRVSKKRLLAIIPKTEFPTCCWERSRCMQRRLLCGFWKLNLLQSCRCATFFTASIALKQHSVFE